jgi:hypothetical protein
MKLKNLLVVLIALVFVFAISCKERGEDEEQENASLKAKGQVVKKAESEEAEEGEEGEEAEEREAKQVKVELPAAVAKVIKDNVPGAEIGILTIEEEAGLVLYDIEFKAGMGEIEVAEDGTVMDVSTIIVMKDLPKAAAAAIEEATEGGTIKQIEKSEVRAEIRMEGGKGIIVKLAAPKYVYEAEFLKEGRTAEIQVAPDGTVVEAVKWVDEEAVEKEEAIAPDALPAAVLQALAKAYPGYKILQAEVTTEGGKSYELQIEVDGKKTAVAIDPSGKIIK